ncbi:kinase-like domain-containing protein, partial [Gaertneriomyces semiglobifer]
LVRLFFGQVCSGVEYCHSKGIFHRDLKPENILITYEPHNNDHGEVTLKIADFGLSTTDEWSWELKVGSRRYMAPECFSETGDFRSSHPGYSPPHTDIWALGILLLNLLFAKNPWHEASNTDVIYTSYLRDRSILKSQFGLTTDFENILTRILDQDWKRRMQDVGEVRRRVLGIDRF